MNLKVKEPCPEVIPVFHHWPLVVDRGNFSFLFENTTEAASLSSLSYFFKIMNLRLVMVQVC